LIISDISHPVFGKTVGDVISERSEMGDSLLSAVAAAHLCETTSIDGARNERQMTPLRVSHLRSVMRTDSLCVPLLLLVIITLQIKLLHHLFVGSFCFEVFPLIGFLCTLCLWNR